MHARYSQFVIDKDQVKREMQLLSKSACLMLNIKHLDLMFYSNIHFLQLHDSKIYSMIIIRENTDSIRQARRDPTLETNKHSK